MHGGSLGRRRRRCGIAARLGAEVPCPDGGCRLLTNLDFDLPREHCATCPIEECAEASWFDPTVVRTLDELRRELDRVGTALSAARATRSRSARHDEALRRWPPQS
jgi:hypothetical protein